MSKEKKTFEKLSFDKETIAKLQEEQASEVEGGATYYKGLSCCGGGNSCIASSGVC